MRKNILKTIVFIVAACLLLPLTFSGCASKGETLLSLDDYKISENIYQLMLTQQKGKMAYAIYSEYGDYNSEKFWGTTIDMNTQITNEDFYNKAVLDKAKNFLCALKLYDELKSSKSDFKMPETYLTNIEAAINDFVEYDADGSKTKLNNILSQYGINMKMLEEFLIMEAKAAYVVDYLYGADGSKIGTAVKNEYFKNNYVACKQIIIQKYYYIYETDEDNNEIYYDADSGKIIYDTSAIPAIDANGEYLKDKDGTQIYYNKDGSIAYDKKNGQRKPVIDSVSGEAVYKMLDDDTIAALKEKAQSILAEADEKGINGFDVLRRKYSEDYNASDKTDGVMYYATNVNYSSITASILDEITSKLSNMEIGDVTMVESDLSFNILIKAELGSNAYDDENFKSYFSDTSYGVFDFIGNLKSQLYANRLAEYVKDVKVDEKKLDALSFSISNVLPNFYYPDVDVAYHFYDQY